MLKRVIEISSDSCFLFKERGSMVIQSSEGERKELGRVPLDDIGALVGNAHGLSYTNNLLVALAERGVPFVLCGANHNVAGVLWSTDGHHLQSARIEAQLSITLPLKKRLWASIVSRKLYAQAQLLDLINCDHSYLVRLAETVKSGDSANHEALGARYYWPMLFGHGFHRDRSSDGINSMLNYGYTVLRAAVARAVVASGLHPSVGLHHSNDSNPFRLVDDLIEPFRPAIDFAVYKLWQGNCTDLTKESKILIAQTLFNDLPSSNGVSPIYVHIQNLASSLGQVVMTEKDELVFPSQFIPE
jgi:CRISP-associated protein Cas1